MRLLLEMFDNKKDLKNDLPGFQIEVSSYREAECKMSTKDTIYKVSEFDNNKKLLKETLYYCASCNDNNKPKGIYRDLKVCEVYDKLTKRTKGLIDEQYGGEDYDELTIYQVRQAFAYIILDMELNQPDCNVSGFRKSFQELEKYEYTKN